MNSQNNILLFLKKLKKNNNREWFNANKDQYEEVKAAFQELINNLIAEISKFDPSIGHLESKNCIFRIYRDVRFSPNKAPYKTNLGAHITLADKTTERAGYYLQIEPGNSFIGGGAYHPSPQWIKAIREAIDYNGEELIKIVESSLFKKYFGSINGEKLTRNPKGFTIEHPNIELLKFKSLTAIHSLEDDKISSPDLIKYTGKVFKTLMPFNNYLNHALEEI